MNPILEAVIADGFGAVLVAAGIVVLFVSGEVLRRYFHAPTEYTRKLSHLGSGCIVITFPWLFESTWTVALLAGSFVALLMLGKITGTLESVHDVKRRTSGAYYYPFAVLGTFWLADGDPLLFAAPIAVMALADTGAAIVGKQLGTRKYRVLDGSRSLEGSLTFFSLAFSVILISLGLAGEPGWPELLLVTLVAAIMATAAEAISVRGADNLVIPYSVFLVLERTLRIGLEELSSWFEGMIVALLTILIGTKHVQMSEAGGVTLFIVGTLAWTLGGWAWAAPLITLFALYILTAPVQQQAQLEDVFPTTVASMLVVLAFGHMQDESLFNPYLATLSAGGAIALHQMATIRKWPAIPLALSGSLAPLLPMLIVADNSIDQIDLTRILMGAGCGLLTWVLLKPTQFMGRRLLAALLAGAIAWG